MPDVSIGPILLGGDVETAARDTLQAWMPFYLAEIDEADGRARGTTVAPRLYTVASDGDRWLEETPPTLVVVSAGTVDDPERHGKRRTYGAWWRLHIAVTVGGATEKGARNLAHRHAAAVRFVFAQIADLGGLAEDTRWRGEAYNVLPRKRALQTCEVIEDVYVSGVVDSAARLPADPPDDPTVPPAALPTPTSVEVDVTPTGGHTP